MRRWLWIVALLILIAAADAALWFFATQRLQAGLSVWTAQQRAAGWNVSATDQRTGGWPFAATLRVSRVAVDGGPPLMPRGFAWRSDHVTLRISMLHPATLQIDAAGTGEFDNAAGLHLPYTARRLVVELVLGAATPPGPVGISIADLTVGRPGPAVTVQRLTARIDLAPEAITDQPAASVSLSASGVHLPPGPDWALGQQIALLAGDAALTGPLPREGSLAQHAITWRDDGGGLDIRDLHAVWGPLHLHAKARLRLDPDLQPAGSGTATVAGYTATADALAAHGIMTQGAAIAAKALLSLMAQRPGDGGPSEVTVPLSLQHRTLSMQQVPLVRLPVLDWPGH